MTLISGVRFFGTYNPSRARLPKQYHLLNCLSEAHHRDPSENLHTSRRAHTRVYIRRHYFKLPSTILGDRIANNIRRIVPPPPPPTEILSRTRGKHSLVGRVWHPILQIITTYTQYIYVRVSTRSNICVVDEQARPSGVWGGSV